MISMSEALKFKTIYNKISEQALPVKTAYKLSRLFRMLNTEIEFYTDKLSTLVDQYAQKDENGNRVSTEDGTGIKIQPDKMTEFQKELNELLELQVDTGDISFTLDELSSVKLTLEEFDNFVPFIKE